MTSTSASEPAEYVHRASHIAIAPVATPSHGRVRLDGDFAASYMTAYAAAWQALVGRSQELAIPLLSLQRHHFELTLKHILGILLGIRDQRRLGHEVFGWAVSDELKNQEDWDKDWEMAHTEHIFPRLFAAITKNLNLLGLPPLPDDFRRAKELFAAIEGEHGNGSHFRYETVPLPGSKNGGKRSKERKRIRVGSFPTFPESDTEPKEAQLDELASVLAPLAAEYCRGMLDDVQPDGSTQPTTFREYLGALGMAVHWDFANELQALETATRNGQLSWMSSRETLDLGQEELNQHLCAEHLTADYRGRRFVIVVLRDWYEGKTPQIATKHECLLGCQLTPSLPAVSELITPAMHQSNLIGAAFDLCRNAGQPASNG